jgi:hypothetical protein
MEQMLPLVATEPIKILNTQRNRLENKNGLIQTCVELFQLSLDLNKYLL